MPWLSVPENAFPARHARRRRKARGLDSSSVAVELPAKDSVRDEGITSAAARRVLDASQASAPALSEPQTPTTSVIPSDADSTHPTTPSSTTPKSTAQAPAHAHTMSKGSKVSVPVVPVVPVVPQIPSTPRQPSRDSARHTSDTVKSPPAPTAVGHQHDQTVPSSQDHALDEANQPVPQPASPVRSAPKSWADLVRAKNSRGVGPMPTSAAESMGIAVPKSESLAEVVSSLGEDVSRYGDKVAFLEPRGLVNTGNMCYMNSVSRPPTSPSVLRATSC